MVSAGHPRTVGAASDQLDAPMITAGLILAGRSAGSARSTRRPHVHTGSCHTAEPFRIVLPNALPPIGGPPRGKRTRCSRTITPKGRLTRLPGRALLYVHCDNYSLEKRTIADPRAARPTAHVCGSERIP